MKIEAFPVQTEVKDEKLKGSEHVNTFKGFQYPTLNVVGCPGSNCPRETR